MFLQKIKNGVRLCEAHLTPRTTELRYRSHAFRFFHSFWWANETQPIFDEEIVPYFEAIRTPADRIRGLIDAGAATGLFAVAAARIFPGAQQYLFEPSPRQRALLRRNLRLNRVSQPAPRIFPQALWNRDETLQFRTIGAMSSVEKTSHLAGKLSFTEEVGATSLDRWAAEVQPAALDLLKMDIEGAEVEALEGGRETLRRFRPELLVMAYHERDGARTFEACAALLADLNYEVRELPNVAGFLHAWAR